jgi:ribonuclease Y
MNAWILIGVAVAGAAIGGLLALAFVTWAGRNALQQARKEALQIHENALHESQNKVKELELAARSEQMRLRELFEKETDAIRNEIKQSETRLSKREDVLDRKLDTLTVKEKSLDDLETRLSRQDQQLKDKDRELSRVLEEQKQRLLQMTGMTQDQAKELLLRRVEDECRHEAGAIIQRVTEQANEEAKDKSRMIILSAIQRYAAEQTADHTVSTVAIPSDDMKGRVIGREGRNIRAFEKSTGVDVIIDETPGVVVVSCFDPVRREIARIALERLVQDGRIHPARIEEITEQVTKEMEEDLLRIGKEALQEANIPNVARAVVPMLGRLQYRTSYGQNVLKHSMEVAYIAQIIASELGLDPALARRCGLLHDIGKALDHEHEGGHPQLGREFLRRFAEPEAVLNACEGHHGDVPATTPYTPIVTAADAISASRPGARRESLDRYIKRLQDLEALAKGFDGVRQAYAIQAGREVRVIVDAKMVDDRISSKIARDIARKIENEMTYPGEVKVTLIREVRAVEIAR